MRSLQAMTFASLGVAVWISGASPAAAQTDFYKGKTIELIISTGVGGGLDSNGRIVARRVAKHIPGTPTIVPKNMPGAGHIRAAKYVYSQAPRDGTTIGTFIPIFVMAQVLERSRSIQFDPAQFNWLISTASNNSTIYTWHKAGIKSVEDATRRQVLMGGTGVGSYTTIYPTVMNNLLGTRFKLVMGYQSTSEIGLALERGKIEGRAGNNFNSLKSEHGDWLRNKTIDIIAQVGLERDPEFSRIPLMLELAKSDESRQVLKFFSTDVVIGRPFVTSPGVPADRVALLRKAFDDTMKDPAFIQETAAAGIDLSPVAGEKIQKIVADLIATPDDIVTKAKLAMDPEKNALDEEIHLSIATEDYDHFRDFRSGAVQAEGIEHTWLSPELHEIFARFTFNREWDVSELSFAKFSTQVTRKDPDIIALPVVCSRHFRFSAFYVNRNSGIKSPKDLKGRKVGSPEWAHTAAVYMRGWLNDEHGVSLEDVDWYQAGTNEPGRTEKVELNLPKGVKLTRVDNNSLSNMVASGELDCALVARPPDCFQKGHPEVARLFPNYLEMEEQYYTRTKIWPIMHVIAIKRAILDQHPWIAGSLYNAFNESKNRALGRMFELSVSRYPLPWLTTYARRMRDMFGGDPFPFGIEENRPTFEQFLRYTHEQGIAHRHATVEEIFPKGMMVDVHT